MELVYSWRGRGGAGVQQLEREGGAGVQLEREGKRVYS